MSVFLRIKIKELSGVHEERVNTGGKDGHDLRFFYSMFNLRYYCGSANQSGGRKEGHQYIERLLAFRYLTTQKESSCKRRKLVPLWNHKYSTSWYYKDTLVLSQILWLNINATRRPLPSPQFPREIAAPA